jgi:hypothetical protein
MYYDTTNCAALQDCKRKFFPFYYINIPLRRKTVSLRRVGRENGGFCRLLYALGG